MWKIDFYCWIIASEKIGILVNYCNWSYGEAAYGIFKYFPSISLNIGLLISLPGIVVMYMRVDRIRNQFYESKYQNRLSGTQVYSHAILWYTNVPYSVSSHLPCILFYLEANQIVPVQYSSYSSGNIVFNWNITIKGSREGSFNYIYNRTNFYFFQNLYYFPFVCSNWFVYFRFSGNYLRWGVVDICFSKLLSLGCRKLRRNNESNGTTPFNF